MEVSTLTLNDFLQSLRALNRSENTIQSYSRDLSNFIRFYLLEYRSCVEPDSLEKHIKGFTEWSSIEIAHLKSYLAKRSQQNIHPRTLARELSSLRSALNYFSEQGVVTKNIAKLVKAPKLPQPLPKSLDVDQAAKLLSLGEECSDEANHLQNQNRSWQVIRDQAVFELLYSAGLRVSECAQLNALAVSQSLASGWVVVLGKGNKQRMAPVGSKANKALQDWLVLRDEYAQPEETALFVNRFGKRLGVRSIQQALDKRAVQAELATKLSPHRLRHACATHVLESSGDLRAVQEMLGHANLSTTQIYTKLDLQHLAKVYDQAHPRAKK